MVPQLGPSKACEWRGEPGMTPWTLVQAAGLRTYTIPEGLVGHLSIRGQSEDVGKV